MADEELLSKIHGLGDLDLAALLCLTSREHCIISTEPEALDDLVQELQLVVTETFNLKAATVSLTPETTLDDFAASILLNSAGSRAESPLLRSRTPVQDSYFYGALRPTSHASHHSRVALSPLSQISPSGGPQQNAAPQIANVILARDLDKAPKVVQIQALELMRTRRIYTRTSVQTAPKQFLFIAVLGAASGGEARVTDHLNDFFYLAHWHDPLDGFAHLEEQDGASMVEDEFGTRPRSETEDSDSDASVVRRPSRTSTPHHELFARSPSRGPSNDPALASKGPLITEADVTTLSLASREVNVDVEVLRYQMNLISFMRMHQAVTGGIIPLATKHFDTLVRSMAVLHGLDYVTPALVVLALRKIYLHRIRIVRDHSMERSMQWGSEAAAVEQLLEGVGPEEVMEDVIDMVDAPL
ncbi:hypothetical protein PFICI_07424 [Pestalotiopsis fici W106-1]|uniref:magnesium chelatase n=1 Tax=Pestalotiopsis fici (strain W106-1 / CGMCC3.15140) TaxID=1229662 RepID=W3X1E4_PESFW|nr:uncharacterized protein PFICI_07424 [Pestalotiopsis fici W106-1]ETS79895.1 hypothetical protein PFICI_07424 [Pestalotiopsis fici W106-1]